MSSANPSTDQLAKMCLPVARKEAGQLLEFIKLKDLTACEMIALLTILRPVAERVAQAKLMPPTGDQRLVAVPSLITRKRHAPAPV